MGIAGIFVIFTLLAIGLDLLAPRYGGILGTLLKFYLGFLLVATCIELRNAFRPAVTKEGGAGPETA
ncbi:hypothetical protein HNW77_10290 [Komagataeibacter sp. AV436]|uniref:Uncharacterized protein n=1 Tax=Komagataeibacter melomenusus TaxID=2766578 RepID=A0ABX2AEJ1_9PROT|nr:hypothetical protein [Komagataeibacter melomenusus]MBV1831258.1 hypothetical protein [Komagataeibacter melomenusus]NPC66776.1 hypothetical protein [Komagataeibacter melomenusus]